MDVFQVYWAVGPLGQLTYANEIATDFGSSSVVKFWSLKAVSTVYPGFGYNEFMQRYSDVVFFNLVFVQLCAVAFGSLGASSIYAHLHKC